MKEIQNLGSLLAVEKIPSEAKISPLILWFIPWLVSLYYQLIALLIIGFLSLVISLVIKVDASRLSYSVIVFVITFELVLLIALFWATRRKLKLLRYHDVDFSTTTNAEKVVVFDRGFYLIRFITDPSYLLYMFRDGHLE